MMRIIPIGLEFPAIGAGVFVADAALPSGRDKAVAVGISTSMNELINRIIVCSCRIMPHELSFCLNEIISVGDEGFDLCVRVPDLCINIFDKFVMSDGGLSSRKHCLFLSEKDLLLMSSKVAGEEGLCESDALNLRMSELNVAEQALGNGDVVATEEGLITGSAGGF